jgi:flagellar capping protein FliD
MGISINGPSGIDTAYIIDSLVELEYERVRVVEQRKDDYQRKIDAYSEFSSLISSIGTKAAGFGKEEDFNLFEINSSNEDVVTLRADLGSNEGRYDVEVFQLARAEKMVSADKLITDQHAALSTFGITTGEISINGTSLTVDGSDTIQDLRMKINNTTDANGDKLGVTASVLKVSDANYRLVLSSSDTGGAGAQYQDVTGSTLQGLGIIQDAAGSKGNQAQQLVSASDVRTAFEALAVGESVTFSGTDRFGNAVEGNYVKTASSTADHFAEYVGSVFSGMANATFQADGTLSVTDQIEGTSQMSISSFSVGATAVSMSVAQTGAQGTGVLTTGADAFFSVDGLDMQSSSNSASGFISGVTLELQRASIGETVTVSMERDLGAITEKVKELLTSFNDLVKFVDRSTRYGDPEDENDKKGMLAGDMTARSILSQVRSVFQSQFDLFDTPYSTASMLGIKTSALTGELELDENKFKTALEQNFNDVVKMFTTIGYSDNQEVTVGRYTDRTQEGEYTIEEVDADHVRIQLSGDTTWYTSSARAGDVVTFSDGPAQGMSLTTPSGSIGTSSSVTFSRGLSGRINALTDKLTDKGEGMLYMRQETWRQSISSSDDRIARLERSIESYRERLVKQFSTMEQTMSAMQSQSANMMSALGFYSG